ncbi:hypothetical protein SODALDRAFT_363399 [Sodiomyces alkalinus F11]|uniref:Uncharacterized protein n=1 Tax=Sodiomyces alkalinus (strain CBS 110278 / VKM F-3762 / F11) TaxID=1314773 RepID=A0A3N2PM09_SODAK|nr:hypothetical protein SODALDRAFT_363399 [Sodiomyces alkalinus F11]ROT35548.1 hypothetical protein SODALDRAFT_363399 [Sodiomyces alkalinus F11]
MALFKDFEALHSFNVEKPSSTVLLTVFLTVVSHSAEFSVMRDLKVPTNDHGHDICTATPASYNIKCLSQGSAHANIFTWVFYINCRGTDPSPNECTPQALGFMMHSAQENSQCHSSISALVVQTQHHRAG